MKYDFFAIGDITTDAFIEIKDASIHQDRGIKELCFRFGEKIEYENMVEVPAVGNSANAAVSAARLGLKSALLTHVGDDFAGQVCISQLHKESVSTDFVKVDEGMHTNYHYVLRFGPERTILVKQYPYKYTLPAFDELPSWIYFSSIGDTKDAVRFHGALAKFLSENKDVKLAFQPGTFQIKLGYEKIKELYKNTEIFFCNKEEAQYILDTSEEDMKKLLKMTKALGPKIAVITDGPNGAFAFDGSQFYTVPMYPDIAPPVDRTGAGDAFASTVVAFLAQGYSLEDALIRGPINSMSVVQYIGAQKGLLNKEALEAYLASAPEDYKVKIESI